MQQKGWQNPSCRPQFGCFKLHSIAHRLAQLASRALGTLRPIWARAGDQKGILDLPAAVSASVDTGEPRFYLSELIQTWTCNVLLRGMADNALGKHGAAPEMAHK